MMTFECNTNARVIFKKKKKIIDEAKGNIKFSVRYII